MKAQTSGDLIGQAQRRRHWAGLALSGGLLACAPEIVVDADETTALEAPPHVQFDPAERVLPFPNNLLLNPNTGLLNLPAACEEAPGSAQQQFRLALNQLDGFGLSNLVLRVPFSAPIELDTLEERLLLVRIAEGGQPLESLEPPLPFSLSSWERERLNEQCEVVETFPELLIQPDEPLRDASTYAVFVLAGAQSTEGIEFSPSVVWALVRQTKSPVIIALDDTGEQTVTFNATPFDASAEAGLAALSGLEQLWTLHEPVLRVFDSWADSPAPQRQVSREDVLVAWSFNTQSALAPFDSTVVGSPAAQLRAGNDSGNDSGKIELTVPLAGNAGVLSIEELYAAALPGASCESLRCDEIGSVYAVAPNFVPPSVTSQNFLANGRCANLSDTSPSAWSDPIRPIAVCEEQVPLLIVIPQSKAPVAGYPVIIFSHGLGRSKEDLLAIAGALAASGIASVSLDTVAHGSRAVSIDTDTDCQVPGEGNACSNGLTPACAPECFTPFFDSNFVVTRDNIRQTVIDHLALIQGLRGCSDTGSCGLLHVDPNRIGYVGHSLGALVGGITSAVADISASVLNVGGADWINVLTSSDSEAIRCPVVNRLIDSGILKGQRWSGSSEASGNALCLTDSWRDSPAFQNFSQVSRWVLDPADAINFARQLGQKGTTRVLVQQVAEDRVVPSSSTELFAKAIGLEKQLALAQLPLSPSATALQAGSQWLQYENTPAQPDTGFPGTFYHHGSLLQPAAEQGGELGTVQMQMDAIAYLKTHL